MADDPIASLNTRGVFHQWISVNITDSIAASTVHNETFGIARDDMNFGHGKLYLRESIGSTGFQRALFDVDFTESTGLNMASSRADLGSDARQKGYSRVADSVLSSNAYSSNGDAIRINNIHIDQTVPEVDIEFENVTGGSAILMMTGNIIVMTTSREVGATT